jgi:hypothetical protein
VKLALDDFGTGYSSLTYVRRFSLDMLKIDKSFIDGIDSSPEDRAIVRHIVGMADTLGMTTVAEGVERPEQLAWLSRLGCQLAQGFALARPMTAPELEAMVLERLHRPFSLSPEGLATGLPPAHDLPGGGDPGRAPEATEATPPLPARKPKAPPTSSDGLIDLRTPPPTTAPSRCETEQRPLAAAPAGRQAPRLPRFREFHGHGPSRDQFV